MDAKVCRLFCGAIAAATAAVIGTLLTTVGKPAVDAYFRTALRDNFILTNNGSAAYSGWANSSDPTAGVVYSSYVVYNVTNPDEILAGGKPLLVEMPAITYYYNNMKFDVEWDAESNNDLVRYKQYQYYVAADAETLANENLTITTLNLAMLSALSNPIVANFVAGDDSMAAWRDPKALFVQRRVRDVIWGYANDTFFAALNANFPLHAVTFPADMIGLQLNDTSMEYADVTHSRVAMHTGVVYPDLLMSYQEWDGSAIMECCMFGPCGDSNSGNGETFNTVVLPWNTPDANAIAGAEGAQFKVGVDSSDVLTVSTYDFAIYRHWDLVNANEDTYSVADIDLLRFSLPANTLGNITVNPVDGYAYNGYGPSGLFNQSACSSGAPIFLSKPRFLDADPSLAAALQDFPAPIPEQHDTWLGVETNTGTTIDFHWRVAINARVAPLTGQPFLQPAFTFFNGVTPVYLPLAYGSQDSSINDQQADLFHSQVGVAIIVMKAMFWGGIALAAAGAAACIALVTAALCVRKRRLAKLQLQYGGVDAEAGLVNHDGYSLRFGAGGADASHPMGYDADIHAQHRTALLTEDVLYRPAQGGAF